MKPKILLILLAIATIAYLLYLYKGGEGIREGDRAPGFSLPMRNGGVTTLEHLRGKVTLLNFWATWCPPCREEMPSLEGLKRQIEGKEFQILAVSVDEEGWSAIDSFLRRTPITMTILLDARGDVAEMFGTSRLPESFLIDKQGIVVKKYTGPRDWTEPGIVAEIKKYVEDR